MTEGLLYQLGKLSITNLSLAELFFAWLVSAAAVVIGIRQSTVSKSLKDSILAVVSGEEGMWHTTGGDTRP